MIKSSDSSEEFEKHANSVHHAREDSEYVRLVISNETRAPEAEILQPRPEARKSLLWWVKALVLCVVIIISLLVLMKWGVPFVFEKVPPILYSFALVLLYMFHLILHHFLNRKLVNMWHH